MKRGNRKLPVAVPDLTAVIALVLLVSLPGACFELSERPGAWTRP